MRPQQLNLPVAVVGQVLTTLEEMGLVAGWMVVGGWLVCLVAGGWMD